MGGNAMPSCARKDVVREGESGVYHCISRCVRHAFLLGKDRVSGRNYNHRRQWIAERLQLLVSCFAIDVCFDAVASNHMHLVLRVLPQLVDQWTDREVARRWLLVTPGKRYLDTPPPEPTEKQIDALVNDPEKLQQARKNLCNLSKFMAALNEHIARRANQEDGVTGAFWEGRFWCREVTDEAGLLTCGLYVDLNLIRAGESTTPEDSEYTSVYFRVQGAKSRQTGQEQQAEVQDGWLAPLTLSANDRVVASTTGPAGLRSGAAGDLVRQIFGPAGLGGPPGARKRWPAPRKGA